MSGADAAAQQVWNVFLGKPVVDATGKPVGKVARITPSCFVVRCGYLFHKEQVIARDDVERYEGGKLVLKSRQG